MPDEEGHPGVEEMQLGVILTALADPLRRYVVTELIAAPEDSERTCASFGLGVAKSTLTHHFRVLRESGLVWHTNYGNSRKVRLRRQDLETRFPGLLALLLRDTPTDSPKNTQAPAAPGV
ncbi:HTH arsR-type domain-containing protein [Plantibacter sp. RU18]